MADQHRHHRLRWLLAGVAVVAVVGAATGAVLFVARSEPDQQSVDDAVEEFRGQGGDDEPGAGRPDVGVYPATGEGDASLGLLGLTQSDGPSIPITVVHEQDGCWSLQMALNQAHRQVNHLCRDADGDLVEPRSETEQSWDLGAITQENHTVFVCDGEAAVVLPADPEAGRTWEQRCTGTNSSIAGSTTSAGTSTVVGFEALEVDGTEVATVHVRQQRTITGGQEGDQQVDHWYDEATGLLVREERRSQVATDSPVGSVEYVEDGWWQLTSLTPQR